MMVVVVMVVVVMIVMMIIVMVGMLMTLDRIPLCGYQYLAVVALGVQIIFRVAHDNIGPLPVVHDVVRATTNIHVPSVAAVRQSRFAGHKPQPNRQKHTRHYHDKLIPDKSFG
jgi:hypothetical protein